MNIRNNKGITLIAEVLTVIMLIMVISTISYSSRVSLQIRGLNNMYADIISIQEKAINYYLKTGKAPINEDETIPSTILDNIIYSNQRNPNDSNDYYTIDFTVLPNLILNNKQTDTDFYFINEKTLTVYITEGIRIENMNNTGETLFYYTLPANYRGVGGASGTPLNVNDYQN